MTFYLLLSAVVLMACIVSSKVLTRFGVPALLIFILLGMVFGSDGIFGIPFADISLAGDVCSVALLYIMFYGGFCTNWEAARPVAARSIWISTLGVIVTAVLTGLFCAFMLKLPLAEAMLVGAVIGSTDAASVFSILRSKKLNLKGGLASLLEIESGSNDPMSYMLTMLVLSVLTGSKTSLLGMFVSQAAFGLLCGFLIAWLARIILQKVRFDIGGLHTIFVVAVAMLGYALPTLLGGNGYLSVYIVGIVLGNSRIPQKKSLIHFFDGLTWLMQIVLFFMLGLLSFPSRLPGILVPGVLIALFLLLVARPAAIFGILVFFKVPVKQMLLVSWAGLRGAASIAFAIQAIAGGARTGMDLFHIVFFVCLFSVALQGTLLPWLAKKLDLIGAQDSVLKTFNDFEDETGTTLLEYTVLPDGAFAGETLAEAEFPDGILVVMIKRGTKTIIPRGSTRILGGDILVLNGADFAFLDKGSSYRQS